ncbi:uncharacterized protein A4U43_C06F12220 [Asparagus officinalis]|uniref:Uncharacterized protein n=1 Tax=Asparagus officinalis TaxID=4686 RepID=A0A5P1EQH2_ASPOF|nr:uncharacterized protein A4U43_C06F12220 [Asparagus officinalis]
MGATQRLQLLKDMGNQSPGVSKRHGSNSLRLSSSSPGLSLLDFATQHKRRSSSRRAAVPFQRSASDPGNSSDNSDKHSEASPRQSMDGNEISELKKLYGGDIGRNFSADFDSDERLSDVSDSCLSVGAENESLMNNSVELPLFTEHCRDVTKEKMFVPSQVPRPTPKRAVQTTSMRIREKESMRSSSIRKSTTNQATPSSTKYGKRWQ